MADNYFEEEPFEQVIPFDDQLDIQLDSQQDSQMNKQQDSQMNEQQQYQQVVNVEGKEAEYVNVITTQNDGLITTDRSYYH